MIKIYCSTEKNEDEDEDEDELFPLIWMLSVGEPVGFINECFP